MALIMNHNLPALRAARFVGSAYNSLSKSIERLSSGLRINSAADDAAGLAVRELMRADIAAGYQGIRNAADGVSLIQTADGALGVIDAKLIKMKELAMQAATQTYSDVQREMINSEYQAMAADIDRIANSTVFNGVRLLDGSMNNLNNGQGIKIHFGTGNSPDSDYYFLNTQDTRATTATGLKIGGDGKNDIWSTGSYGDSNGCCGGSITSLSSAAVLSGRGFVYGYNWDGKTDADDDLLLAGRYIAGRYGIKSGMTYEELIGEVNAGTQSRIGVDITLGTVANTGNSGYFVLCLGENEAYFAGDSAWVNTNVLTNKAITRKVATAAADSSGFAKAINGMTNSQFWALASGNTLWVFNKNGGDYNGVVAEELISSAAELENMTFVNAATGNKSSSKGTFSLGGEHWGTMVATQQGGGGWSLTLLGKDIGDQMDLRIAGKIDTAFAGMLSASTSIDAVDQRIGKLAGENFTELQNASDAPWVGAEIRTMESAARAMAAVEDAITRKDQIRARLGAFQTSLESIIESQTIHMENLQAAESRISDVDVAMEMTEFTKNNVLVQAATAMLAQANSMGSLALSLILG
jgi:flagellin